MSSSQQKEKTVMKTIIQWQKYILFSFYCLVIGFCAAGIWIKFNTENQSPETIYDYTSHIYEEGFDAVEVSVPMPRVEQKSSFLERLSRAARIPQEQVKPARDETANQTWQKYATMPVLVPDHNAKIILVIDDLGIVKGVSKQLIDMNVPLTLSFLPYASDVKAQVNDAYDKGHDILVHIPMEPKGDADPGPHALFSSKNVKEQREDINYNLSQFSHYIGINNHMGSAFTENEEAVGRLLDVIKDKGLFVLDSKTTNKSKLESIAYQKNIPVINRDVFLDNVRDVDAIMGQLEKLEKIAKSKGIAVAIGHPYRVTVSALEKWIPTLKDKGISIVPISQIIKEKYADTLLAVK